MPLDPTLTLCAVILAFLGWVAWEANVQRRREQRHMTPEERAKQDTEDGAWGEGDEG